MDCRNVRDPRVGPVAPESTYGPQPAAPGPPPGPAEQLRPSVRDDAGYLLPNHRCAVDAEFAALVNLLESLIAQARYTPTELREACLLAAIRHEQRNPRPIRVRIPGGLIGEGGTVTAARPLDLAREQEAVAAEYRLRQKATDDGPG